MKKEDFEIPFWHDWFEADYFEKSEMIENLPVLKEMVKVFKENKLEEKDRKIFEKSYYRVLNGLFEDLANYMMEREAYDRENKKDM